MADELPENAAWDDVMERVYLEQAIKAGLKASTEGKKRTRPGRSQVLRATRLTSPTLPPAGS